MPVDPASDGVSSQELCRQARGGDRAALAVLVDRYGARLLARIRLMMGDAARQVAESGDFLQATLLAVAGGVARLEPRDDQAFLRWATEIARNRIRDGVRRRREQALQALSQSGILSEAAAGASPASAAGLNEQIHRLAEALEALPEEYRRVIELRDFDGLSHRAIAAALGKPSEAAAQMLHARAMARLAATLR